MKKSIVIIIISCFSFCLIPTDVFAQRGCCSHHGGVSGSCSGGKQVCNDGSTSPSCTCNSQSSVNGNSSITTKTITYVYGCTDSSALNYNSKANKGDGSCIAKVEGCMNQDAINYNSEANTSDASCRFEKTIKETKKIKYKTKKKFKWFESSGTVLKKGKKGLKSITKKITTDESGNVIDEEIIKTKIIKKPVTKIIVE